MSGGGGFCIYDPIFGLRGFLYAWFTFKFYLRIITLGDLSESEISPRHYLEKKDKRFFFFFEGRKKGMKGEVK